MIVTELDRVKDKMFHGHNFTSIHIDFDEYMRYAELLVKERAVQAELRKATALEQLARAIQDMKYHL